MLSLVEVTKLSDLMSTAPIVVAVLDDEANMRVALSRLLGPRGYEVVLFENGPTLLEACRAKRPDCIILDLHMPKMNGFGVLEHLAEQPDAPPVIVITGHDQAGNAERVTRLGARAYFIKPVDKKPLLEALALLTTRTRPAD